MGSLFPCLPDDLGWQCLVRVELSSHGNLRGVSKSWNAALKRPEFYEERRKLKISEQRICMIHEIKSTRKRVVVYNPEKNSCKSLPPFPIDTRRIIHCHLHFVKQKLVLITDLVSGYKRSCTWLYDFSSFEWRKGSRMPTPAIDFACAADEQRGLIYVAGGSSSDRRGVPVPSASVYNVEEDKWDALPDMNVISHMLYYRGLFADGKFYVRGNPNAPLFDVFDPSTNTWETILGNTRLNRCYNFVWAFEGYRGLSDRGLIEHDYNLNSDYGPKSSHILGLNYLNRDIRFCLAIGHKILVIRRDENEQRRGFDILEPSNERGGEIQWRHIERPSEIKGTVMCVVTLEL